MPTTNIEVKTLRNIDGTLIVYPETISTAIYSPSLGTNIEDGFFNNPSSSVNYADAAGSTDYATEAGSAALDGDGNDIVNTYVPFTVDHVNSCDLNTVVTSGFHRLNSPLTNGPTGAEAWGQLIVSRGGDTITQIYSEYNTGTLYTRSGNSSDVGGSGSWTSWKRLLNETDASNYITLNTAQTITGVKTFQTSNLKFQSTAMTKGSAPSSTAYQSWWFVDSTNNNSHSGGRLGGMEQSIDTSGQIKTYMRGYANIASSSTCADIYILTDTNGVVQAGTNTKFYGAVWNDYAEYREGDSIEPGYVMVETGDDTVKKSSERLEPFAGVSSDTFGFAIGQTDQAKTPIAVSGRVLVHPLRPRDEYKPGDCVCAAAGGKVDIMTREEIQKYPDRIVGTVSSVPQYEVWGQDSVPVNGRIWIKVK